MLGINFNSQQCHQDVIIRLNSKLDEPLRPNSSGKGWDYESFQVQVPMRTKKMHLLKSSKLDEIVKLLEKSQEKRLIED